MRKIERPHRALQSMDDSASVVRDMAKANSSLFHYAKCYKSANKKFQEMEDSIKRKREEGEISPLKAFEMLWKAQEEWEVNRAYNWGMIRIFSQRMSIIMRYAAKRRVFPEEAITIWKGVDEMLKDADISSSHHNDLESNS